MTDGATPAVRPLGALAGLKVLELGGIGPGPFGAMVLADHGADVVRIERPSGRSPFAPESSLLDRGKRLITVDLKTPEGLTAARELIGRADVVIEGFRPGVAERLGVGPDICCTQRPELIYARMTGWGQEGPMAQRGGHDIDYIALAGALEYFGGSGVAPTPPLNLLGDFAGGGLMMALGILLAVVERQRSGRGQVVDAAMVDGVALLMTLFRSPGVDLGARGTNDFDGHRPMYAVYETSDGRYMAVGSTDAQFYAQLLVGLGLDTADLPGEYDRDGWPLLREVFRERFASRTQAEWTAVFDRLDAAVVPIVSLAESLTHPHALARSAHVDVDGVVQPAPAPRLSRTPGAVRSAEELPDLASWGLDAKAVAALDAMVPKRESA